jgi:hypothetical protein
MNPTGPGTSQSHAGNPDAVLVGAGIMSATWNARMKMV